MKKWQSLLVVAACALLLLVSLGVAEAAYPDRSIELVAWASPGGGSDFMMRTFAKAAQDVFPASLYVVNKSGSGGAVGMAYVTGKQADGYTILGVTNNLVFTPLTQPSVKNDYTSFTPIGIFGIDPKIIVTRADGPYTNIEDLVQVGTDDPGSVKFGLFGVGTDDHIVSYWLAQESGAEWTYIPYSGGGEQVAALLGGHIDAIVTEPGEVLPQVEAGKLKVVAVALDDRLQSMSDVPTLSEYGWNVVVPKFRGLVVKRGTPEDVVAKIRDWSAQTVSTPVFTKYREDNLLESVWIEGDAMEKLIEAQVKKFGEILSALNQ